MSLSKTAQSAMEHQTTLASDLAKAMYPTAPQLWIKDVNGVVGVSADAPGVSFWKIKNGIRLTGMASFKHIV
jgi:thiosulfate dehydrogenase